MAELTLRNKLAEILSRPNNPELEMDFRATCSELQLNPSLYDPPIMQAYQDYLNAYQQKTSLYNFAYENKRTSLIIYNTETETQEAKALQTPQELDKFTCIAQLPNGKLFCFGNNRLSRITVLIDRNGGVEVLPSGTRCQQSSCIYFNNSVYCFGGQDNKGLLTLSCRFDLDQNRWIKLTPMPQADLLCNSIMFNGNILISGYIRRNLCLYSTDIDSFSTIPYKFSNYRRKILINSERLYLIECIKLGKIYESEIGSYMDWTPIGNTSAINCRPVQVYCSYNKGGIYFGIEEYQYYKFDLNEKRMIELKS
ncbi:unnamed protein product [Blepharisma stoltei]|uniref:Kelch motif family protein n=1 Tax=Blepharisma stoltei TaxID=1481888 RepID=A0AAU9K742_9CILI|nr:unnamed protein product [Blepharisma stoltei]